MAKKKDQDIKSVIKLMPILAQALLSSLEERYPELELGNYYSLDDRARSNWEYYCITVGAGLSMFGQEAFPGEHKLIEKQLKDYDPKLIAYTNDFIRFILGLEEDLNGPNANEVLEAQIAYWFLSNYKQKKPTAEEMQLTATTLGRALIYTTQDIRHGKL